MATTTTTTAAVQQTNQETSDTVDSLTCKLESSLNITLNNNNDDNSKTNSSCETNPSNVTTSNNTSSKVVPNETNNNNDNNDDDAINDSTISSTTLANNNNEDVSSATNGNSGGNSKSHQSNNSNNHSNNHNNNNNVPKFGVPVPNRVFVGGIPDDVTDNDIRQLFAQYGNIHSVKIITDRAGISKGYGFVTFDRNEDAQKVIKEADNLFVKNRKLNVSAAVMKHQHYSFEPRMMHSGTFIYPHQFSSNVAMAAYNQFYENLLHTAGTAGNSGGSGGFCPVEGLPLYQITGMNGHFVQANCASTGLLDTPASAAAIHQYMAVNAAQSAFPASSYQSPTTGPTGFIYPAPPPPQSSSSTAMPMHPSQHTSTLYHPSQQHLLSPSAAAIPAGLPHHAFQYSAGACNSSPLVPPVSNGNSLQRYPLIQNHPNSTQSSQMNNLNAQQYMLLSSGVAPDLQSSTSTNSGGNGQTQMGANSTIVHPHQSYGNTYPSTGHMNHPLAHTTPTSIHMKTDTTINSNSNLETMPIENSQLASTGSSATQHLAQHLSAVQMATSNPHSGYLPAPHLMVSDGGFLWSSNAHVPPTHPSLSAANAFGTTSGSTPINTNSNNNKSHNQMITSNRSSLIASNPHGTTNSNNHQSASNTRPIIANHVYHNNNSSNSSTICINSTSSIPKDKLLLTNPPNPQQRGSNNNNNNSSSYNSSHHQKKIYNNNNNAHNNANKNGKMMNGSTNPNNNNLLNNNGGGRHTIIDGQTSSSVINNNNNDQQYLEQRPKLSHHHHHHHHSKATSGSSSNASHYNSSRVSGSGFPLINNSNSSAATAATNQTLITKTVNGVQIYALADNNNTNAADIVPSVNGGQASSDNSPPPPTMTTPNNNSANSIAYKA